jgi:serine phosphatase RsbU (regulator of sigma subunit)
MVLSQQEILNFSTYRNVALTSFFLAFGIIFLILFFSYKLKRENLFFSFFCFTICALFCCLEFKVSAIVVALLFLLSLEFISLLLSKLLLEKNKNVIPISAIGLIIFISAFLIKNTGDNYLQISISYLALIFVIFAYVFIFLLATFFKGSRKKREDLILIILGSIVSFILIIISFFQDAYLTKMVLFIFGTIVFPLPFSLLLGRRILVNHNILKHQLIEIENDQLIKIENLAAENLKKEKEKQLILENQNKILEEKVIARTLELVNEKQIVEEKNREILDSILYAKRIQATILPPLNKIKQHFEESFVLYLPKDIVAGDFYWMETDIETDTIFFAVCDCTGHGVPGAFVSVICSNALNKTVREFGIQKPSEILDKVTEIVSFDLSLNNEDDDEIMDGMDISFCSFNPKTNILQWAGANNPIWLIKKSGELIETKADKQPIGKSHNRKPFTNHEFNLEKGDSFYLLSDGYADQFGGKDEIKFQRSRLKELLLKIKQQSLHEQGNILNSTIKEWQGSMEQTDDICVVGIRI